MEAVIRTERLTKKIGTKTLLSGVSMTVQKGRIYGLLGENGAGKTTLMRLLAGLWKPTEGSAEVFDEPVYGNAGLRRRVGSMIELPVFYEYLSGRENLELHGEYLGYYQKDSVRRALELLGLEKAQERPVKSYSLGMKQRLGIARAVMTRPELLILDEPVNGLDPSGMRQVRELLRMLSREYKTTVLISSHILPEIESAADEIGIIHQGRMLREIQMEELARQNLKYLELETADTPRACYVLSEVLGVCSFRVMDKNTVRIYGTETTAAEVARAMTLQQVEVRALISRSESLEDYFLKLTGEGETAWKKE